ncbi:MAG: hypothetical protein M1837_002496 [Sclerophora amabilis]|nr:MAG: hypothetical protein M1837_002496 [Sclerophora amabilis]
MKSFWRSLLLRRGPQTARLRGSSVRAKRPARLISTSPQHPGPTGSHRVYKGVGLSIGTLGLVGWATFNLSTAHAEAAPEVPREKYFRLSEVRQHDGKAERVWVLRGTKVYDITEWVAGHPGGDVILRAGGGSVDPFWRIFSIHHKQDVYDILDQYLIGQVDPVDLVDGGVPQEDLEDPFSQDPERDPRLRVHTDRPCNAETPSSELTDFLTSNAMFYVRNHLWVPVDGEDKHELNIELSDGTEKTYSLKELRAKFKEHTVTVTLQCSGNRRKHMTVNARSTNGLQWEVGAIGTADWTGVRLRDVLADVGLEVDELPEDVKHVHFVGSEAYGASIPAETAVDRRGDVLLAYKMNGETLPRDHGYPLRVVVPGTVAARSVKWVSRISTSDEESTSQWQRRDYKCFGPNEGSKPDWDKAKSIQELPVQSAITSVTGVCTHSNSPHDRKLVEAYGLEEDSVVLQGYAVSGGGREIARVDISLDDGHTWRQAEILADEAKGSKHWTWKRWKCIVQKRDVSTGYLVKAVDDSYNTQPETHAHTYNFRGNLATAWHRISADRNDRG